MKMICRLMMLTLVGFVLFSCTAAKRPKTDTVAVKPVKKVIQKKPAAVKPDKKAANKIPAAVKRKTVPAPAVSRLMDRAGREMEAKRYDSAFGAAERALRLDPSNARIWTLMAEIQLRRGNGPQAEQLAEKSNLLAKEDHALKAKNWRIISEALKAKGNFEKAKRASEMAEDLESMSQ